MLTSKHSANRNEHSFTVRPNASLNSKNAALFFIGISLVCLLIAVRFALLGAWVIIPFALAELCLLAICILTVLKSNQRVESIEIKDDIVTVTQSDAMAQHRTEFQRHWVQLISQADQHSEWHSSKLWLRSHGCSTEIGELINNAEKKELERQLRFALCDNRNQ